VILRLIEGKTERGCAVELGIPKSTVHRCRAHFDALEVPASVFAFFTSQPGVAVLKRLVDSLLFCVHEVAGQGLRVVENVLRISGLDRFVASSPSVLGSRAQFMESLLLRYNVEEKQSLGQAMPLRRISLLEDETWLTKMCLVGMEARSGFILLEKPSEKRDGESWAAAMAKGMEGFRVKIMQVTSDEERGLLHHAKVGLGVHHTPDLFHVQRELSRGLAAPLAAQVRTAEKENEAAQAELKIGKESRATAEREPRNPGRPIGWENRESAAVEKVATTENRLKAALKHQQDFREAVRGLSEDYHPVCISQGTIRSASEVERRMRGRFATLHSIAEACDLPDHSLRAIAKAERVIAGMAGSVAFVLAQWRGAIEEMGLDAKEFWQAYSRLMPAAYMERMAGGRRKMDAEPLLAKAQELRDLAFSETSPLHHRSLEERKNILMECREWSFLFQRSSSALEGRNGRLSQNHAAGRGTSERRLQVGTVLANFFVERADGTTAAERFFAQKPKNIVEWVFEKMPDYAASRKTLRSPLTPVEGHLVH
jgi:hypothetical protein